VRGQPDTALSPTGLSLDLGHGSLLPGKLPPGLRGQAKELTERELPWPRPLRLSRWPRTSAGHRRPLTRPRPRARYTTPQQARLLACTRTRTRTRHTSYQVLQIPAGYQVLQIPAGWVIQGTVPHDLVNAPANDPDKNPDSSDGKLFAGMQQIGMPGGQRVPVNGHVARYQADAGDDTQTPGFKYTLGR
jgi:hypothetical protein